MQPPTPVRPLDYATPVPRQPSYALHMWVAHVVVMLLGCLVVVGMFFFAAGRLKAMFADFKVQLPAITQLWLTAAHLVVNCFGWVGLIALAFALPTLVWRVSRDGDAHRALRISLRLTTLAFAVLIIVTILSLFLPMVTLIQSVTGQ